MRTEARRMIQDLKSKSTTELLALAKEQRFENASTMSKQELMFAFFLGQLLRSRSE